ncbi:MAG TPA: ferrochelatase [Candidatus Eremiobacteraceae bacterium]|nr:ferrochelatase [Candidatus Eremiobacteraceae bacterium]
MKGPTFGRPTPAVVLAQLGGPETLADVRAFLYNFFVDLIPDNIPVPSFLVKPLAWAIASWRYRYSQRLYASIGGGSPLRAQTDAQADALRAELRRRGSEMPVYVAMRNWHPFSDVAVRQAVADGVTDLVFLPLYPQYSYSTTRSSLNEFRRVTAELHAPYRLRVIEEYCEEPSYIAALVDVTRRALAGFVAPAADVHLVFSAHGLPLKYIERGDPYLDQIKRTMAKATASLAHPGPAHLAFQSRLGPDKWLSPSTDGLIQELGRAGAKAICVVPIAFVSEHVETLNEIDIQYAAVARECGVAEFRRACAVKCHPDYIRCLADLTEKTLEREHQAPAGATA